jgi:hypothetical protein
MSRSESDTREHARRVADALNRFAGALHGARWTGKIWEQHAENPSFRVAAKYGLQGAFGITVLTLRKFGDLWEKHLCFMLPAATAARASCEELIAECRTRNLRKTANLLFAHYAPKKVDWPLGPEEIVGLIRGNGWDTEEEVLDWVGQLIPKILAVRDEVKGCYNIDHLTDEEVTP